MTKPIVFSIDSQGWVKLQRNLLVSPVMKNSTLIHIYVWCLLKANHQPKWFSIKIGKGTKEIFCDVGQFITGRKRAAEELGIPESTYYKNIKRLEDYGYLKIESNSHYSLVTAVNYGSSTPLAYQSEQPKQQEKNTNETTNEQPKNTNNNYKNEKKENNKKNNLISLNSNFSKNLKNETKKLKKIIGVKKHMKN